MLRSPSRTGSRAATTPSPKASWQAATMASKSERPWSSLVMAMMRGMETRSHSCHRVIVEAWMSSPAGIAKTAASAARSPARSSPT